MLWRTARNAVGAPKGAVRAPRDAGEGSCAGSWDELATAARLSVVCAQIKPWGARSELEIMALPALPRFSLGWMRLFGASTKKAAAQGSLLLLRAQLWEVTGKGHGGTKVASVCSPTSQSLHPCLEKPWRPLPRPSVGRKNLLGGVGGKTGKR